MELLEPDQVQRARTRRRHRALLMRKDQCMHCAEPGCLAACPADGAIVQYAERHRGFPAGPLHRLRVLHDRLPVQHPQVQPEGAEGFQMHALRGPRTQGLEPACIKACPTGCLHFGTKADMKELAADPRAAASRAFRLRQCRSLRSARRRRHPRHLCAARCHQSRSLRRPAVRPADSLDRPVLEVAAEMDRQLCDARGAHRDVCPLPALWTEDR